MNIDRYIKVLLSIQQRESDNLFALLEDRPLPYQNMPSSLKLFVIGIKIWGRHFSLREYEIRNQK